MRRHEVDHALEPHRQFAHGRGRADGEGAKELARRLHGPGSFQRAREQLFVIPGRSEGPDPESRKVLWIPDSRAAPAPRNDDDIYGVAV
jgi:hypothetical protein